MLTCTSSGERVTDPYWIVTSLLMIPSFINRLIQSINALNGYYSIVNKSIDVYKLIGVEFIWMKLNDLLRNYHINIAIRNVLKHGSTSLTLRGLIAEWSRSLK